MPILLLLALTSALSAVEETAINPSRVVDSKTIQTITEIGGHSVPVDIGLAGIATPKTNEAPDSERLARTALHSVLATGKQSGKLSPVILGKAGDRFERDERGRILAIISFPRATPTLSMGEPETVGQPALKVQPGESLQEYMVRSGWAVLNPDSNLPKDLKERLANLQKAASDADVGLWKDYRGAMEHIFVKSGP